MSFVRRLVMQSGDLYDVTYGVFRGRYYARHVYGKNRKFRGAREILYVVHGDKKLAATLPAAKSENVSLISEHNFQPGLHLLVSNGKYTPFNIGPIKKILTAQQMKGR